LVSDKPKKVIFGEKSTTGKNIIFVKEKDFQNPRLGDASTDLAIKEINRIQNLTIGNKSLPELFAYKNVSLWWFFYRQLFLQLQKTLDFITNFSEFVDHVNPEAIQVLNEFNRLTIIKQICDKNKIRVEYPKLNYFIFQVTNQIRKRIRNYGLEILGKQKISKRKKLFHKNKNSIPDVKNAVIFAAGPAYRQEILNHKTGGTQRGEHLLHNVINLIENKEKIIGIDLIGHVKSNDKILEERLNSEILWFPPETLFKNRNRSSRNEFLKKYQKLISSKEFQKLLQFKGISIWNELQNTFEKMKYSLYFPYWLDLIDSVTEFFSYYKPKAVFLPYETGPLALAFISACKEAGVKTLGLQHGFIHKYHVNYSHDKFATQKNPYSFLLPDKLLLYGENTRQLLIEKGYPSERLVTFGNPIFFNLNKIRDSLTNKSLYQKYKIHKDKKIILYTTSGLQELQENTVKHNYDTQTWQYLLENFRNDHDFFIILKPHPLENPVTYEKILKTYNTSNARIIQGNLLELIYVASVVVSIFSTTMFDSLCLRKPVIQLKFGDTYSTPLDDYQKAVFASDLKHLAENIRKILNSAELRNNLIKNGLRCTKDSYNIPEKNPDSLLSEIINK